jgi:hypothetical protein
MTMWEKIKEEAKIRYVIGFLIGTVLAIAFILSFFIEYPKSNEVLIAKLETAFSIAFGAFIQHSMKTPDKEKIDKK